MEQTITVSDILKLEVKPGQVLVVTLPKSATQIDAERARLAFVDALPGVEVVVTRQDVTLQVINSSSE